MTGIVLIQTDLMMVLSGICFITCIFTAISRSIPIYRRKLLIFMTSTEMFLLIFERFSYQYSGDVSNLGFVMVRLSNFMVFCLPYMLTFLFALFLADMLKDEGGIDFVPSSIGLVEAVSMIAVFFVLISQFTGLYYSIDPATNLYVRAPLYILSYIPSAIIFPTLFYTLSRYGKKLSKGIKFTLYFFIFIPLIAVVLQFFLYGLSLTSISMVLPVLLMFLIELHEMDAKVAEANRREISLLNEMQFKTQEELDQAKNDLEEAVSEENRKLRFESQDAFFNILSTIDEPEQAIRHMISVMGHFYEADRVSVFVVDHDANCIRNRYEWTANGVSPKMDELHEMPIDLLKYWRNTFGRNGILDARNIEDIRESEKSLYEMLKKRGVYSFMCFPIMILSELEGMVAVENRKRFFENYNTLNMMRALMQSEMLNIRNAQKYREEGILEEKNRRQGEMNKLKALSSVLADDYSTICEVNPKDQSLTVIKQTGPITDMFGGKLEHRNYESAMKLYISEGVLKDDQEEMLQFSNLDTLLESLDGLHSFSRVYRNNKGQFTEMKAVRNIDGMLIVGFGVRDAQIRKERAYERKLEE